MSTQIDDSIPILTEVIYPEQETPVASPDPAHPADAPPRQPAESISAEDWQQLEQTLRENVLRQVLSRIDFVLEHRVRDSLADVLQTAVENLALEIRSGLHHTMEEVITRAVTQEIARAKASK